MNTKYDYAALSKRMTNEMNFINEQKIIKSIHELIHNQRLEVDFDLFGGAVRDLFANKLIKDRDILIVGQDGILISETIQYNYTKYIKREPGGGYFNNQSLPNIKVIKISIPYSDMNDLDIDFVFVNQLSDKSLDFDVNKMRIKIPETRDHQMSLNDIFIDSMEKLPEVFFNILSKKCVPTSNIMEFSDLKDCIHNLYRFCKMMDNKFNIEHPNYISAVMRMYQVLKNAIERFKKNEKLLSLRMFFLMTEHQRTDQSLDYVFSLEENNERELLYYNNSLSLEEQKERELLYNMKSRVNFILQTLTNEVLSHVFDFAISMAPLKLSTYVQLWILELEYPIVSMMQLKILRMLSNVNNSYARKKLQEQNKPDLEMIFDGDYESSVFETCNSLKLRFGDFI